MCLVCQWTFVLCSQGGQFSPLLGIWRLLGGGGMGTCVCAVGQEMQGAFGREGAWGTYQDICKDGGDWGYWSCKIINSALSSLSFPSRLSSSLSLTARISVGSLIFNYSIPASPSPPFLPPLNFSFSISTLSPPSFQSLFLCSAEGFSFFFVIFFCLSFLVLLLSLYFFFFWNRLNWFWMASAAFSVSGASRSMSTSSSSSPVVGGLQSTAFSGGVINQYMSIYQYAHDLINRPINTSINTSIHYQGLSRKRYCSLKADKRTWNTLTRMKTHTLALFPHPCSTCSSLARP